MTTDEKCAAILKKILETVNEGGRESYVAFRPDWDGYSATVEVNGGHSHVGWTDHTWDQYVDLLYQLLCEGRGLSWV